MAVRKGLKDVDNLTNSQIFMLICEYVHKDRDRAILVDRLINGDTFETLAEKHDLSVRQVKNIVYKLTDKIF